MVSSLAGTTDRVTVSASVGAVTVDIAATYAGQTSITTLGTITTGVWNGTPIANANLGNSSVTYNGVAVALGASGTITAAPSGSAGGDLGGTYPNPNLINIPSGIPVSGNCLFGAMIAPATPAAGKGSVYVDITSKNLAVKDDAGVVKHGVQTLAAVASKWITSIDDAGLPVATQPNFTDLAGNVTGAQGGLGLTTAAVGDLTYASATTPTWARLADVATGSVLVSGGVNTAPAWSASPALTSLSFAVVGASTLKIFNGGATNNYGFGIQGSELQCFAPATAHISFNGGGDVNASGTNEIARFTVGGGLTVGGPTGGDKGTGTINAATLYYANNTAGVTAGSFSVITAITAKFGLVTQLTGSSDERLKDWWPNDRGLADLRYVRPIRFHWNETSGFDRSQEQFGFSAQNVRESIPEAVGLERWADGREWLTLNDRAILGATVNAINELGRRLEALEAA